ncbi:MAG: primase-helicase zinc-binding domain-containing protein [Steroidobacteraceae bacterium]
MSEHPILRAADIHAKIGDGWPSVLMQLGIGEHFLRGKKKPGPCPACGGTDRYFFDNRAGRGDFHCRHCGAGDGFALLMRVTGTDFATVRKRVMEVAGLAEVESERAKARQIANLNVESDPHGADSPAGRTAEIIGDKLGIGESIVPLDWSASAERIWRMTLPLGTLARTYLTGRGCLLPPGDGDLRFLLASDRHPATLCARVTDAVTGKPISLHFTPLAADGSGHGERRLLAGHRKRGGVIRLWPNDSVTYGLGVAEGIETAIAAARIYAPMWATIDAGNLASLPVLSGIDCLAVYADHDDAGIAAAQECGRRWLAADREVCVYRSRVPGEDIADLMRRRAA